MFVYREESYHQRRKPLESTPTRNSARIAGGRRRGARKCLSIIRQAAPRGPPARSNCKSNAAPSRRSRRLPSRTSADRTAGLDRCAKRASESQKPHGNCKGEWPMSGLGRVSLATTAIFIGLAQAVHELALPLPVSANFHLAVFAVVLCSRIIFVRGAMPTISAKVVGEPLRHAGADAWR